MKNKRFDRIIRRKCANYRAREAVSLGKRKWYYLYDAPSYVSLELFWNGRYRDVTLNWNCAHTTEWRANYSEYWRLDALHDRARHKRLALPKRDHTGFSKWDPIEHDRWKHPTPLEKYYADAAKRIQLCHAIIGRVMIKEHPAGHSITKYSYSNRIDIYTAKPKPNITQEEMIKILLDFLLKKEDNLKTLY